VYADIVVVTFNDNLVSAASVSLVVPMSVMVVVVVMVSMISVSGVRRTTSAIACFMIPDSATIVVVVVMMVVVVTVRVRQGGPSTDVNIVIIAFDDHHVVRVLGIVAVVVIVMVVMMMVTVARIREGGRRATLESDVAVHTIDVDEGFRPALSLHRWLSVLGVMRFVRRKAMSRQKRR
jgi:hypothetical protein